MVPDKTLAVFAVPHNNQLISLDIYFPLSYVSWFIIDLLGGTMNKSDLRHGIHRPEGRYGDL